MNEGGLIATREVYYYKFKGEINTEHVIEVAVQRAIEVKASALIVRVKRVEAPSRLPSSLET